MSPRKSGKQLVAEYLTTYVGAGNPFRWLDVKHAFPHISQIDRRGRELRDYDWVITTYREDPRLPQDQVRLDKIGRMP
jgi:hypothetical protein